MFERFVPDGAKLTTHVVAGGLALLATGCAVEPPAAPPPAAPEVTVASPVQRDVTNYAEFTGRTTAVEAVEIRARVAGELQQMSFDPSDYVRSGDLLFVIEQEPYVAARDAALANIAQWESELLRAQSDLSRLEQAIRTNAVSEQDVDQARADVQGAEANLAAAQAGLRQTDIDLGYTRVTSPIDGMVGRNLVDLGNLVGAGDNTLLTTVMKIDPIYAYFDVSESILLSLLSSLDRNLADPDEPGASGTAPVFLGLDDETGWPHEGVMDYMDNTVDAGTGTLQVRGLFPNPTGKLFPGLFARIRVLARVEEDAVLVDENAIGTDLGGKFLLLVGSDNVVELRHVELGALEDDGLRVVRSGLAPGERYITNGLQRARPGLPVTPTAEN